MYLETRVKNQMKTFLKHVNKEDIYYLTSTPNIKDRQFGWNCMDDKSNLMWKYIHFIFNMAIKNYDWYVFIQDDTFVFRNRLENLLVNYNANDNIYIGKEIKNNDGKQYISIGAGLVLSKNLYNLIHQYIIAEGINNVYKDEKVDICFDIWLQGLSQNNTIQQINYFNFYPVLHENDTQIDNAITFHKVIEKEQFEFYCMFLENSDSKKDSSLSQISVSDCDHDGDNSDSPSNENTFMENHKSKTVFVILADSNYYGKAKRTVIDLRSRGNWRGDIVFITINFNLNANFKDFYNVTEKKFDIIDKTHLLSQIGYSGFTDGMDDRREIIKLYQWEKLHVFDDYFKNWQRVVFLDAGLRVCDDVKNLLELDYKNKILASRDGKINHYNKFTTQLSAAKPEILDKIKNDFGNIMDSTYMLNCLWVYDTNILNICNKSHLIDAMNTYTFCKSNEMGIMNLMFHFKHKLWEPFPIRSSNNKILFDWCELNQNYHTTWRDYCFIKYPISISFEDV